MSRIKELRLKENSYQIKSESKNLTLYKRNKGGQFNGRFSGVPAYFADGVKYIQLNKDIDRKGVHLRKGEIVGRLKRNQPIPKNVTIHLKRRYNGKA